MTTQMTTADERSIAAAVVAVAKAAVNYDQVTELWTSEDERFEYARNCIREAINFDRVTPEFIAQNPDQVIERDLEFA